MRPSLPGGALGAGLIAILLVAISGSALAYFSTTGTGNASAGVTTLNAPSIAAATPAVGGTVALTWSAVTPPGPGAVTYSVSRDGGAPAGNCPGSSVPAAVTACTDEGLAVGTHSYVVTANWRSWSRGSSTSTAKITVGPATHLAIAAATKTPTVGNGDNLTITAKDASESTVTTYTGSHSLTFSGASASPGGTVPTVTDSGGAAVAFGGATALSFNAGVASVSGANNGVMKLYRSGATSVDVSDGSISSTTDLELTVAATTASTLLLAAATTAPVAGVADNLTITAQDTYGNTATSYTGSHSLTFSGASASPGGTVPTVANSSGTAVAFGSATALSFSAGVAAVSSSKNGVMKLYRSGATNIDATDGSISNTADLETTVSPAAASKFSLAVATTTPTAGAADNLTIAAQDTYANTVTSYAGSHSLTFSGASASPGGTVPTVTDSGGAAVAFGGATALSFNAGVASVSGANNGVMTLYKSAAASVKVSDGSISATATVTASPAATSKLLLAAATTAPTVGAADNLTITAQDTYGNTAISYTGPHSLTFSGASASPGGTVPTVTDSGGVAVAFGGATALNFTAGVATVSGANNGVMKLYKSGAASIGVTDGSISNTPLTVTAAATTASNLLLAAATTAPVAGVADNLTITAQDTYGNTATSYTGSHSLTFSGASASPNGTLPTVANSSGTATAFGSATALSFSAGVATVTTTKNGVMKLNRSGSASITVTDGSISSAAALAVTVSPAAAARLAFANVNISAGVLGSTCLFTCTVTGLGNSGTVTARIGVTDSLGNTVSGLGSGHTVTVTTNGGAVGGGSLTIASTGVAESTAQFTFTAQSSGTYTDTITAATAAGAVYTNATATATK